MKCKIKINNLYLKDFEVNMQEENIFKKIELSSEEYYECESGEETMFLISLIENELGIPEDKIKGYAIEEGEE